MATKMTSGAKTGLIIGGILLLFVLWLISAYNKLVKEEEKMSKTGYKGLDRLSRIMSAK